MDEIINHTKLTWGAQSNDVFGLCVYHPIDSYQFHTYLSLRKIKFMKKTIFKSIQILFEFRGSFSCYFIGYFT